MKQDTPTLFLRDYMERSDGWGHAEGREVFNKLLAAFEKLPNSVVVRISLAGVSRTDASFPRESVIELAKRFRTTHGFCLVDILDSDILDNWDAAAIKKQQPMFTWHTGDKYKIIGPMPAEGLRASLELVALRPGTTTAEAAHELGLNVSNISNKFKALWEQGFVLRRERTATTGGIEYEYIVPK